MKPQFQSQERANETICAIAAIEPMRWSQCAHLNWGPNWNNKRKVLNSCVLSIGSMIVTVAGPRTIYCHLRLLEPLFRCNPRPWMWLKSKASWWQNCSSEVPQTSQSPRQLRILMQAKTASIHRVNVEYPKDLLSLENRPSIIAWLLLRQVKFPWMQFETLEVFSNVSLKLHSGKYFLIRRLNQ